MKVMLSAGEASGDLHGSHLARALKAAHPSITLLGMGGRLMADAGVQLFADMTEASVVGFVEALKSLRAYRRLLDRMTDLMRMERPDALVVIDFPGFNMRLAERAKRLHIPVIYYFSPSAWAWRPSRARIVASHATTVCAVLPFEADVYRKAGAPVTYVGHPLMDTAKPSASREALRQEWGYGPDERLILLLPGSRKQEVERHLALMVEAARRLSTDPTPTRFMLGLAHTIDDSVAGALPGDLPVRIISGRTYDALHAADAAVCAIGTVTLEAAIVGCPFVGVVRTSTSTYWLAKRLYRGRHFAMPNIIADREIVPELLQEEATGERIAAALGELLSPGRREEILRGFAQVKEALGGGGAVQRTAEAVLKAARERGGGPT